MNKIIAFVLFMLSIWACQPGTSGLKTSPNSGYQYKALKTNDGAKPKVGDHVFFQMEIYNDKDSLLQTYRNQKMLPSVKIVDQSDPMRKKNPVLDIASYLSLGDSVAIIVPVDSVPNMPPGYDDVKHIEYHIAVDEIMDEASFQAKIQAEQQAELAEMERMREELPAIEALTAKTLAQYKAGNLETQTTAKGVKYFIHERGDGDLPTKDLMVTMTYYGLTVADGKMFDNSYKRGRGYSFRLGRREVIDGWDDVALNLPVGTKASVFIPSEMGYGTTGSPPNIPPDAELYFYVVVDEMYY